MKVIFLFLHTLIKHTPDVEIEITTNPQDLGRAGTWEGRTAENQTLSFQK